VGLIWRANLPEPGFWTPRRVGFAYNSVLDGLGTSWAAYNNRPKPQRRDSRHTRIEPMNGEIG
jgi:hypothetical protein